MPFFEHDGIRFHYRTMGRGTPVVWQHGLGSDADQTFALLTQPPGLRLPDFQFLGFDARAHGETRPMGDLKKIALSQSADDLVELLNRQQIEQAVIGGISMGAAIALNFVQRFPERVLGLILSRPAWLDRPFPENLRTFTHIARYLRTDGPREGLRRFRESDEYQALLREAPDSAQVVVNNFQHPRALECVARLERIPHDAPSHDRQEWQAIRVPTLVLANRRDPFHPWELAQELAASIPGAELQEITSKSVSLEQHAVDIQNRLTEFLNHHYKKKD